MTDKHMERYEIEQSILFMCRMTFKSLAIALVVTYAVLYVILHVTSAEAASLKSEAVINGQAVKLSDLFDDIPEKQDAIVGNAPSPGQSVILNARTLERISNVYNVKWTPAAPTDQIVVRSAVQTVTTADIMAVIKKDLMARGVSGNFEVTLNNVAPTITLPGNVDATAEISQMNYTAGRDVFSAVERLPCSLLTCIHTRFKCSWAECISPKWYVRQKAFLLTYSTLRSTCPFSHPARTLQKRYSKQ